MRVEKLDRFAPPGMGIRGLRNWTIGFLILSTVFSMGFLLEYFQEFNALKRQMEYPVYAGMTMTPFRDLIVYPMILFRFAPVVPLLSIPSFYLYYYQETKSVYLMKRLESPWEMHCRCLILPFAGMFLAVLAGAVVYGLYYLLYLCCTPEHLLPAIL